MMPCLLFWFLRFMVYKCECVAVRFNGFEYMLNTFSIDEITRSWKSCRKALYFPSTMTSTSGIAQRTLCHVVFAISHTAHFSLEQCESGKYPPGKHFSRVCFVLEKWQKNKNYFARNQQLSSKPPPISVNNEAYKRQSLTYFPLSGLRSKLNSVLITYGINWNEHATKNYWIIIKDNFLACLLLLPTKTCWWAFWQCN